MPADELITGIHPVYEALVSGSRPLERIHVARDSAGQKLERILEAARSRGLPVRRCRRDLLDKMAPRVAHQGVVAVVGARSYVSLESLIEGPNALLVVLDRVQDPRNLGSVIRTAESAGATGVVVTERHTAPLTDSVARASAGAVEHLPVARVTNLASGIKAMQSKGLWVVGVDPVAEISWTEFDYAGPLALVFGGEHRGMRRLVRESCDVCVHLPMAGRIESLNLSVAVGIVLYEVVRQRLGPRKE